MQNLSIIFQKFLKDSFLKQLGNLGQVDFFFTFFSFNVIMIHIFFNLFPIFESFFLFKLFSFIVIFYRL